jgi:hypothetical protein
MGSESCALTSFARKELLNPGKKEDGGGGRG